MGSQYIPPPAQLVETDPYALKIGNSLSDVTNKPLARENLGVGTGKMATELASSYLKSPLELSGPFPMPANKPLALIKKVDENGDFTAFEYAPVAPNGTVLHEDLSNASPITMNCVYFSEQTGEDEFGNPYYTELSVEVTVGYTNVTVYTADGDYTGQYLSATDQTTYKPNGTLLSTQYFSDQFSTSYVANIFSDGNGNCYVESNTI